jgi:hypothetical protein
MRFEADGRRHDPNAPKGVDVPKILVVGCSFTQGEGVADDEPYPRHEPRAAESRSAQFATGGYGTYQSLLRMQAYFRSPTPRRRSPSTASTGII